MKKLDTSAISASTGFPVKSGTLQHIQAAYTEVVSEGVKSIIGPTYDATKVYILSGLVNSGTGLTYAITAGSVFFNGEVYLVPAFAGNIVGPNVLVGAISTSFFSAVNADPVQFTDGIPRNVHQIRQIILQSGLSGSGAGNYLNFSKANTAYIPVGGSINYKPTTGDLSEFDVTGLGTAPNVLGWALCNGNNGTYDERGLFEVMYKAADADFGTLGVSGGSKTVTQTGAQVGEHDHVQNGSNDGGGSHGFVMDENNLNTTGTTTGVKTNKNQLQADVEPMPILNPFITKLRIQRVY